MGLALLVPSVHAVYKARKERKERKATRATKETSVIKARVVIEVTLDFKDLSVPLEPKEIEVMQDHLVFQVNVAKQVLLESLGLPEFKDHKVNKDHKEIRGRMELPDRKVILESLVRLEP